MIILGVESTAHTFGIGIVTDKGKILANVKDSYTSKDAGMIPHEIAEHHEKVAEMILKEAFKTAKVKWEDIEFIAYSAGPGLDPALWKGYHIVTKWAKEHRKKTGGGKSLLRPSFYRQNVEQTERSRLSLCLRRKYTGYNPGKNKYLVLGETLDIGLGNMLDKFGRILGLGFPSGPKIEELAKKGKYIELPYAVKGMDVSFSGLLTKAQQLVERKKSSKEDLCFSLQETAFAMCAEVAERALAHTGKKELLLVGGVGANKRFCEMLDLMCRERNAKFYKVPVDLAGDQGAMIAWEGFLRKDEVREMTINPHWRADEV